MPNHTLLPLKRITKSCWRRSKITAEWLEPRHLLVANVVISEVLARNDDILLDYDDESSDWLELLNLGPDSVDLLDWYLTDTPSDKTKWRFSESTELGPGQQLVVFASDKNSVAPNGEFHTNFKLSSGGEYLALVEPDGTTVASEFDSGFPSQTEDISFGRLTELALVRPNDDAKILVPESTDQLAANWTAVDFVPETMWFDGSAGIGFDIGTLPGLRLWLKADDVAEGPEPELGSSVSVWRDQSGLAHDAVTPVDFPNDLVDPVLEEVTISVEGGSRTFPVVRFSSANELMEISDLINGPDDIGEADENEGFPELTILTVYQSRTRNGRNRPVGFGLSSSREGTSRDNFHLTHEPAIRKDNGVVGAGTYDERTPTDFFVRSTTMTDSGTGLVEEFFDGTKVLSSAEYFGVRSDHFYLGDLNRARGFSVDVAEVLVFNRALDTTERKAVQDYLRNKYLVPDSQASSLASLGPFAGLISTDVINEMADHNASVFTRIQFDLNTDAPLAGLELEVQYEDGYVAYLNGVQVARRNAPVTAVWNSTATTERPDKLAIQSELIDISNQLSTLQPSGNVLAVQGLNVSAVDGDFLLLPKLTAILDPDEAPLQFFAEPSPGTINPAGFDGWLEAPIIFSSSDTFETEISVEIVGAENADIHYTQDGTIPTLSSLLYVEPLIVTASTEVRARTFQTGYVPSSTASQAFTRLHDDLQSFTSDLPLLVIDTYEEVPGPDSFTQTSLSLFTPGGDGRTSLASNAELVTRAGLKVRGRTSAGFPKKSYALEIWEQTANEDRAISLLGLPEESDWVLYASYHYDRSFLANTFTYDLTRELGHYSPRTRYVELFVNDFGDDVSFADDYVGTYALVEKIKRDNERVDVEQIASQYTDAPEITGGYIFKFDFLDPGDTGFKTDAGTSINYVDPKESEITPAQADYVVEYFNEFETVLYGPTFTQLEEGYATFIDVDVFIDQHWINELAHNTDGLRLSTYLYKPRGERLVLGPLWDFDKSYTWAGQIDVAQDVSATTWYGSRFALFWGRLFEDMDFQQRYIDRWQLLRDDTFSTDNINSIIDVLASQVEESQARNFARWDGFLPRNHEAIAELDGTWQGEVAFFKDWLRRRVQWLDGKFLSRPTFSQQPGADPSTVSVSIHAAAGSDIYYTTDESDPREPGGGIAPTAVFYDGPFSVPKDAMVKTRAFNTIFNSDFVDDNEAWSGPVTKAQEVRGDFNQDLTVDVSDIDQLFHEIRNIDHSEAFDLTDDGLIDQADLDEMILNILDTRYGDTDLDGDVDFADFQRLSTNFGRFGSSWGQGDFDGDGDVDFKDFTTLANEFGFSR